jgi:hypothetical protein
MERLIPIPPEISFDWLYFLPLAFVILTSIEN